MSKWVKHNNYSDCNMTSRRKSTGQCLFRQKHSHAEFRSGEVSKAKQRSGRAGILQISSRGGMNSVPVKGNEWICKKTGIREKGSCLDHYVEITILWELLNNEVMAERDSKLWTLGIGMARNSRKLPCSLFGNACSQNKNELSTKSHYLIQIMTIHL